MTNKYKEKQKAYRERNKEKIKQQRKQYREQNKEKIRQQKKDHYEKNSEKIKEYSRSYYQNNKDKQIEIRKQWSNDNPEKMIEYKTKYRNRNKATSFQKRIKYKYGITIQEYDLLKSQAGNSCPICKNDFDWENKHKSNRPCIDHCHITKKIRGIICGSCNAAIGSLHDDVEILKRAIQWLEK